MRGVISVSHDGDGARPEVQVSGTGAALVQLASMFDGTRSSVSIKLSHQKEEHYPVSLEKLVIDRDQSRSNGLVKVELSRSQLLFSGSEIALMKICRSLENFFGEECKAGDHFQLDYYPGNQVLDETPITLIFACAE